VLVLSRRANQSIVIGADIIVRVLDIRGDQVRIGVEAPRSVTVHREEVAAEILESNRAAADVPSIDAGSLPKPGQ
jgi:carbon storage regulator